jgi:hypothetical protein
MKATSVCDFGRNLKQDVVLHVSHSRGHCAGVFGSVGWRERRNGKFREQFEKREGERGRGGTGLMELELGAWLDCCRPGR